MATVNSVITRTPITTHEGGPAEQHLSAKDRLWRTLANCLLFEPTFYEDKDEAASRIRQLIQSSVGESEITAADVAGMAVKARNDLHLRSAPLWATACLATCTDTASRAVLADTIAKVVRRPDELAELISMYWKLNGRAPGAVGSTKLPHQFRAGLTAALRKFDAYQLAKWNRTDRAVKLRDVLRLVHPRPATDDEAKLWKQLLDGTLPTPDTWEVALSAGADKKATWERLLEERRLGLIALLMNLRNMESAGVAEAPIRSEMLRLAERNIALPTQFMSAAKAAPRMESAIVNAMMRTLTNRKQLPGSTIILVDVRGSMDQALSSKSQRTCLDAASGVAMLVRGTCADARVFTFSNDLVEIPARQGFALRDAIVNSQPHSGTALHDALAELNKKYHADRIIVITDEQAHPRSHSSWSFRLGRETGDTALVKPAERGYIMNVASYDRAVALEGGWHRISGFSERVVDWIREEEGLALDIESGD